MIIQCINTKAQILSNLYHDSSCTSDLEIIKKIIITFCKLLNVFSLLFLALLMILFPVVYLLHINIKTTNNNYHDVIRTMSQSYYGYLWTITTLSLLFCRPLEYHDMIGLFSPYASDFKHDFALDLNNKFNEIFRVFLQLCALIAWSSAMIAKEIIFYEYMKSSIFSVLQANISLVIFIIYYVNYGNNLSSRIHIVDQSNMRFNEIYSEELNVKPKKTNVKWWVIWNVIIFISLGVMHIIYTKSIKIFTELLYNDLFGTLYNDFYGIVIIMVLWNTYNNDVIIFVDNLMYLVKTYRSFSGVIRESWELKKLKSFDSINSFELYIDKYMYINVINSLINNHEDALFVVNFDRIMCSGDMDGASEYLNKCSNVKIREFLMNELQNKNNLLFQKVGISMVKNCNSFATRFLDNNTIEYTSLLSFDKETQSLSSNGRVLVITGESGSGKSTVLKTFSSDSRIMSAFINGYSSPLLTGATKKLIPSFSKSSFASSDGHTLRENMSMVDNEVTDSQLTHMWKSIGIEKYRYNLDDVMGMIHFSDGQRDRMNISNALVLLNNTLKNATEHNIDLQNKLLSIIDGTLDNGNNGEDINILKNKLIQEIANNINISSFMVLLDEPLGALDKEYASIVMQLIKEYSKFGFTFLIIDHSGVAEQYADDVIKIQNKTFEYFTRVGKEFVNLKDLPFNDDNTLIVDSIWNNPLNKNEILHRSTAVYRHICNEPPKVSQIRDDYINGRFKDVYICDVSGIKQDLLNQHKADDGVQTQLNSELNN